MKILIALLIAVSLTGCVSYNRAKVVKVPVVVCPAPEHRIPLELPVDELTVKDYGDWEKIAKAYAISIVKLKARNEELERVLDIYRTSNGEITDGSTDKPFTTD